MSDRELQYLEDKKYIHETLKHTVEYVETLNAKFEDFKLETAKSIAVIQTKLALYVAGGSIVIGIAVNLLMNQLKG